MRIAVTGLVVLLFVGVSWSWAQVHKKSETSPKVEKSRGVEEPQEFDFWMTAKLRESQKIFAGLASADYKAIAESANTLRTLSKVERFVRKRNPDYRVQLHTFEFATAEIEKQAYNENMEGVVLGFNQLTLSCVNCHKKLRDVDAKPQ